MNCYFDDNNQFYTIGGLVLLGLSLGANIFSCAYFSRRSKNKDAPFITSESNVRNYGDGDDYVIEMGEDKSTNTSPHICSVRRFTPVWNNCYSNKSTINKAELPEWARKEFLEKNPPKQNSEFL
jgi:hypothetical protein